MDRRISIYHPSRGNPSHDKDVSGGVIQRFQKVGIVHNWDVGMLEGMAGSGRGNFPSLGCVIPVWFRKNQWDGLFWLRGVGMALGWLQDIPGMSPECHWNVTPSSKRDSEGITKNPQE